MPFTVRVSPSERQFEVRDDETLLAASLRQSIGLPYGCQDGACGGCRCKLISGEVTMLEYQDKALSAIDRAQGEILACRAMAESDIEIESLRVASTGMFPSRRMPCRVVSVDFASDDVAILKVKLPANEKLRYRAGQYINFLLRDGLKRSYSMASAPHVSDVIELHIRHMSGGKFTDQVFSSLKKQDLLRLEGPFGTFYLREESDRPLIMLVSGTGFAPIKAVLEHMHFLKDPRKTVLYWGGRTEADLYALDWVKAQIEAMPQLSIVAVISESLPEDRWYGRCGLVHEAVMQDFPDLSAHDVYACGTPVMVDAARRDFLKRCNLPEEAFFADSFTSEKDK